MLTKPKILTTAEKQNAAYAEAVKALRAKGDDSASTSFVQRTLGILPNVALSVRQPWPHRIFFEGKDIENRSWSTKFRGQVLIHASKGVDPEDRDDARLLKLPLGGIVGVVEIVDCVSASDSEWFFGPYGFVLRNTRPLPFTPCVGRLGFFRPDIDLAALAAIAEAA